jgi:hypothetical protein
LSTPAAIASDPRAAVRRMSRLVCRMDQDSTAPDRSRNRISTESPCLYLSPMFVPMPDWVKQFLDQWFAAAEITNGKLFKCVCRSGTVWGDGMTEKVVWHVVKTCAKKLEIPTLAPHDLRRSCARFCHSPGGELEQIQFLLGHVSVQTTERYLGCKKRFREAVNDRIGIEPIG